MKIQDKILSYKQISEVVNQARDNQQTVAHCHGCFDIVHPGHVRHLKYASEQADFLVVTLTADDAIEKDDGARPYIPQELRAENLAALACVSYVVISHEPTAEKVLEAIRPDYYFKGAEYENSQHPGFLKEQALVESNGGQIIFSSGEVVYSSTKLVSIIGETPEAPEFERNRLEVVLKRWGISKTYYEKMIRQDFANKRIAVVGDSVWDHYIFCEANDVAKEAAILSVKPQHEEKYLGAAAIIASHLKNFGADVHMFTGMADDQPSEEMLNLFHEQNIHTHTWNNHQQLPVKTRYLADTQKLFKVDRAENQPIDSRSQTEMLSEISDIASDLDAIIFADFGYGTLSPGFMRKATKALRSRIPIMVGDVSGLRRSLLSCHEFDLLTPTEQELRGLSGDFENSLPTVSAAMIQQLKIKNLLVTMNQRGCVMFRPRPQDAKPSRDHRLRSDYLPALVDNLVDPMGAGDAMLAATTIAMTCGADLPQATYLGSCAAALEIQCIGNQPIHSKKLIDFIQSRTELPDV